ncbi:MAG: pyridoxamine 5'-phosphate oxidase family protein [Polyangiaceae bacterium]
MASNETSTQRFLEILKGFETSILLTHTRGGALHGRPMALGDIEDDGVMWFLTRIDSPKVEELQADPRAIVTCQTSNQFATVNGLCEVVKNAQKLDAIWKEPYRVWFEGKSDPKLVLLRFTPDEGEYWDNSWHQGGHSTRFAPWPPTFRERPSTRAPTTPRRTPRPSAVSARRIPMKSSYSVCLALAALAACSHRHEARESASANRTTVKRVDDERRLTAPSDARSSADYSQQPETPAKREVAPTPAPAQAKSGTRLTDSGNTVAEPIAADNTALNERDQNGAEPTPMDQSNSERDLKLTQQIRRAVMGDDSLSFTAKNEIISSEGRVTLRGPVNSRTERDTIDNYARRIAGERAVDDQLEVKP